MLIVISLLCLTQCTAGEVHHVDEGVPRGTSIGFVEEPNTSTTARYLVVYPDNHTQEVVYVDERTGEIRVIGEVDHERDQRFDVLAVPMTGGKGIQTTIIVKDLNDNSPIFPNSTVKLQISEFAKKGAQFPLPSAVDPDSYPNNIQSYRILRGNLNNVFRLESEKVEGNELLYLQVNGQLDREYRDRYDIVVEARDGGVPPRKGELMVRIVLLDVNDNAPRFAKLNYSVVLPFNTSPLTPFLNLTATDADIGENAAITYHIANTKTAIQTLFAVSPSGGLLATNLLPSGTYEMVVVAADGGVPPLEGSTLVTVHIEPPKEALPEMDVVWLNGEKSIREDALLGSIVSRVALVPPRADLKLNVSCAELCVRESDAAHVYLLSVCAPLDRETRNELYCKFSVLQGKRTIIEHKQTLKIVDVNDNPPTWPTSSMYINMNRTTDEEIDVSAEDPDEGANGQIEYSIHGTDIIHIDSLTGRIRLMDDSPLIGCNTTQITFQVVARDKGEPPLSSTLQVQASVQAGVAIPVCVGSPFVSLREDLPIGSCFTQIPVTFQHNSCQDAVSRARYTLSDLSDTFTINTHTGTLCTKKELDFEKQKYYQLSISVYLEGTESETSQCTVNVEIVDVNDNDPQFSPLQYVASLIEGHSPSQAIVRVLAYDADSLQEISYHTSDEAFNVNKSGDVSAKNSLSVGIHHFTVQAMDGGNRVSKHNASITIHVLPSSSQLPHMTPLVTLQTTEDVLPGIMIGTIEVPMHSINYASYSDDDGLFVVHSDTGRVAVAHAMDSDKRNVYLLNIKGTSAEGDVYGQVEIHVADNNDNTPIFAPTTIYANIPENYPLGQTFCTVHATDADPDKNGMITYSVLGVSPNGSFSLNPLDGKMQLLSPVDYEMVKEYRIKVRAEDGGIPTRHADQTVILRVYDINDNAPAFEHDQYSIEVVENSPPLMSVAKLKASDADSGMGGKVEYSIEKNEYFTIDQRSGVVILTKVIDREQTPSFTFTVRATDKGQPPLSANTTLNVKVLDDNDHTPSCPAPVLTVLPADMHNAIGTLHSVDLDEGKNGIVTYSTDSRAVVIKPNGQVFQRRPIMDGETIQVVVRDGGKPARSNKCEVKIIVASGSEEITVEETTADIHIPMECAFPCTIHTIHAKGVSRWNIQPSDISNLFSVKNGSIVLMEAFLSRAVRPLNVILEDEGGHQKSLSLRVYPPSNTPTFSHVIHVPSSTPIGSKIGSLDGMENNGKFYYTLLNDTEVFQANSEGSLFLTGLLSSLSNRIVVLHYRTTSMDGTEWKEGVVRVEVEGKSPGKALFCSSYVRVNIAEDTKIGSVVYKLNESAEGTTDDTAGIFYRALSDDIFTCDPISGEVTLNDVLDTQNGSDIASVFEASTGGHTETVVLHFIIEEKNNHVPYVISASTVVIAEQASNIFHYVVAKDDDQGESSRLTYNIVSGNCCSISATTGALSLVHRPTADSSLVVAVSDNGVPPLATQQTIHLIVQSQKWHFFDRPFMSIRSLRAPLLTIPHQNSVRVTILPPDSPFHLDNGELKTNGKMLKGDYTLSLVAEKDDGQSDCMTIEFAIGGEGEHPQISSMTCQSISIMENQSIKNLKRIVAMRASNNATFHISSGNDEGLFSIHPLTGVLSSSPLDRETKAEHMLVVTLIDGEHYDSCSVRIIVRDENDNEPVLTSERTIRLTNGHSGSTIAMITATDKDEGENAKIIYQLEDDPSNIFDVSPNGHVIVRRDIPFHTSQWVIQVRLMDSGKEKCLDSTWEINVMDERTKTTDDPSVPAFQRQSYYAVIEEGMKRGHEIGKISTSAMSPITFSIVGGNVDYAFDVDDSGTIRTVQELDREVHGEYSLTLIATGQFSTTLRCTFNITVLNINDNPPSVQAPPRRRLSESLPSGSFVSAITATDVDDDSVLVYSLLSLTDMFTIDPYSGVIHTIAPLDYETQKELGLHIGVSDGIHQSETTMIIALIDENDNSPHFSSPFYDLTLWTSTAPDTPVAQLLATDSDSGENGQIEYSLVGAGGNFVVHPTKGSLVFVSRPATDVFLFSAIASDNGTPIRRTSVPIRIRFSNSQNDIFFFKPTSFKFEISESHPQHSWIGNISMFSNPSAYRIADSHLASLFFIDNHGQLFSNNKFDREKEDMYRFHVVSDGGTLTDNSTAFVSIHVLDENDNSPVFDKISPVIISENMHKGEIIQRIFAADPDKGANGTVSYIILSGNDAGIFELDEVTGALVFNEWNDWHIIERGKKGWEIVIAADDHGIPKRRSILRVPVQIKDSSWRGSAPFFPLPRYDIFIREDTTPGTMVYRVRPISRVGIPLHGITYSISEGPLSIHHNGAITLRSNIDYETKQLHILTVTTQDSYGRSAIVPLHVNVLPIDEYPPIFSKASYSFQIPVGSGVGDRIGQVTARDEDRGRDGNITYRISGEQSLVDINTMTGQLSLRKAIGSDANQTIEQLVVIARSGPMQQSATIVFLEIAIRSQSSSSLSNVFLLLLTGFALLFFLLIGCILYGRRNTDRKKCTTDGPLAASLPAYPSNSPPLPNPHFLSSRSHPDSGIDVDASSDHSSLTEYLNSIGVHSALPLPPTSTHFSKPSYSNGQNHGHMSKEDPQLTELIYARVEEVVCAGPLTLRDLPQCTLPSHPATIAPPSFQPLADILEAIECQEENRPRKARDYIQITV